MNKREADMAVDKLNRSKFQGFYIKVNCAYREPRPGGRDSYRENYRDDHRESKRRRYERPRSPQYRRREVSPPRDRYRDPRNDREPRNDRRDYGEPPMYSNAMEDAYRSRGPIRSRHRDSRDR
mmetsp:Transcript_15552/g.17290  ORF Transcript_15552/g.17290 Transcript_15552/m.17290 type:complete len:123 (-) Transcript_15552:33-401(-)